MRTQDLNEAIAAVTRVYCPHTVEVIGPQTVDVRLEVKQPTFQPIVDLAYNAAVMIDAGPFSRLFLMMHCARGAASARQGRRTAAWRRGQTMPFSAGCETKLWFDPSFAQQGVRLDMDRLEAQCRRWVGRPLDRPLRFSLRPFSNELEQAWQRSLAYLQSDDCNLLAFSAAGKAAFDEFLLTLLVQHHPHSFSDEMAEAVPTPVPGLVRNAERFIREHADGAITVSDVADQLGVSLRSLQTGFRKWRNSTPSAFLRQVRLQRARDELLSPDARSNVTSVALRYGFVHLGRFSAYYQSRFGEAPSATLRRGRAAGRRRRPPNPGQGDPIHPR